MGVIVHASVLALMRADCCVLALLCPERESDRQREKNMLAAAVIVAVTPMGLEPRQEIKAAVTSWATGSSAAVGAQRWGLSISCPAHALAPGGFHRGTGRGRG